nr:mannose-1-phosphate guanylyltransferase [Lachnospiraceae bacterium]
MNVILLSGGSGRRLWPLSNDVRSKQFLPVFQREDGAYESMVQRMHRKIKEVDPDA